MTNQRPEAPLGRRTLLKSAWVTPAVVVASAVPAAAVSKQDYGLSINSVYQNNELLVRALVSLDGVFQQGVLVTAAIAQPAELSHLFNTGVTDSFGFVQIIVPNVPTPPTLIIATAGNTQVSHRPWLD